MTTSPLRRQLAPPRVRFVAAIPALLLAIGLAHCGGRTAPPTSDLRSSGGGPPAERPDAAFDAADAVDAASDAGDASQDPCEDGGTACTFGRVCRHPSGTPQCVDPSCSPVQVSQLGGATSDLAVDGTVAYTLSGNDLFTYDVSTTPPAPLGHWALPAPVNDLETGVHQIVVQRGVAYVAMQGALALVDVSNPARPVLLSQVLLPAGAIRVEGTFAYVLGPPLWGNADPGNLTILDVENPKAPRFRGHLSLLSGLELRVRDGHAFVVGSSAFRVVDVRDPDLPVLIAELPISQSMPSDVALYDHYAYTVDSGSVGVVDIQDPAHPAFLRSVSHASGVSIDVQGSSAYVGSYSVQKLDLSDPASPVLVATGATFTKGGRAVPSGNMVFAASPWWGGGRGVVGLSASDLQEITSTNPLGSGGEIARGGREAFVAVQGAIEVVDLSNPKEGSLVAEVHVDPTSVAAWSNHLYATDTAGAVQVVDVTHAGAPVVLHALAVTGVGTQVRVGGTTGFVLANPASDTTQKIHTLEVLDVSNADAPALRSSFPLPSGQAPTMDAAGSRAYVAVGTTLLAIDGSDPSHPRQVGSVALSAYAAHLSAEGTHCVVTTAKDVTVLDMADPASPVVLSTVTLANKDVVLRARMVGRNLFLVRTSLDGSGYADTTHCTVELLDVSDWGHPVSRTTWYVGYGGSDVAIADGFVYVTTMSDGLLTFDFTAAQNPKVVSSTNLGPDQAKMLGIGDNRLAVVGSHTSGGTTDWVMKLVDVSSGTRPTLAGSSPQGKPLWVGSYLRIQGKWAYAPTASGLEVYDIGGAIPTKVGSFGATNVTDVVTVDETAYLGLEDGSLLVVDVSNPAQPTLVGKVAAPTPCPDGCFVALGATEQFLYMGSSGSSELTVLDRSVPAAPVPLGLLPNAILADCVRRVAPVGAYVVMVTGQPRLVVVDVSNAASPRVVSSLALPNCPLLSDVAIVDSYAYAACGQGGVAVVDLANPPQPHYLFSIHVDDSVTGVGAVGGRVYALGRHGLYGIDPAICSQ